MRSAAALIAGVAIFGLPGAGARPAVAADMTPGGAPVASAALPPAQPGAAQSGATQPGATQPGATPAPAAPRSASAPAAEPAVRITIPGDQTSASLGVSSGAGPAGADHGGDGNEDDVLAPPSSLPRGIASGPQYEKCLAMLPKDPAGAARFARSWGAAGGGNGATQCAALAAIALGDPARGAAMLENLAADPALAPLVRASLEAQADQAWLMAGQAEPAFRAASAALALSPRDPELLIDRAIAAAMLQRYSVAIADLTEALAIDPKRADALVYRAAAWRRLGDLSRAQNDIDRAFSLDPENADALLERGIIRQRRGDLAGARADWQEASTLAPDSATGDLARQNLALLDAGPQQ